MRHLVVLLFAVLPAYVLAGDLEPVVIDHPESIVMEKIDWNGAKKIGIRASLAKDSNSQLSVFRLYMPGKNNKDGVFFVNFKLNTDKGLIASFFAPNDVDLTLRKNYYAEIDPNQIKSIEVTVYYEAPKAHSFTVDPNKL